MLGIWPKVLWSFTGHKFVITPDDDARKSAITSKVIAVRNRISGLEIEGLEDSSRSSRRGRMPQISEWFHANSQGFEPTMENLKFLVICGLLGIAGAYYLLVALKSMLSRSKGHHIKPPTAGPLT